MKDIQIDVELEIRVTDIEIARDREGFARQCIEKMRHTAAANAEAAGGYVRDDRLPEFTFQKASSLILGGDYFLTASRWWCSMPESFDPERAAAASR